MNATRISIAACLLLAGTSLNALSAATPKGALPRSAIEICDAGASVPFDPQAKAPPVHINEMPKFDRDPEGYAALLAACMTAQQRAPAQQRFALQLIRAKLGGPIDMNTQAPALRRLADKGGIEAQFLYYRVRVDSGAIVPDTTEAKELLAMLLRAANAGHALALDAAFQLYANPFANAGLVRRDVREATRFAEKVIELPAQGRVGIWAGADAFRTRMRISLASLQLHNDGFTDEERAKAFAVIKQGFEAGDTGTLGPYVVALRLGRGVEKNVPLARSLAEAAIARDDWSAVVQLAAILCEGDTSDAKRALAILRDDKTKNLPGRSALLADMLLDNKIVGRDPIAAIDVLGEGPQILENAIRRAALLETDENGTPRNAIADQQFLRRLGFAAITGESGAGIALARLKLSGMSGFGDEVGARRLLARLAASGDFDAQVLLADRSFDTFDGSSQPKLQEGGLSTTQIRSTVELGIARNHAGALMLYGKLMRAGVVFPQDDRAATSALVKAAELGNVEAMIRAGDAYNHGYGIKENPPEYVRWLRAASRLGSVAAKASFASYFSFDAPGKLMTAREGVSEPVELYSNGVSFLYHDNINIGSLCGGRCSDISEAEFAEAVMNGWRLAPNGLRDERLLPLLRNMPDAIRLEMEKRLVADGFFKGPAEGFVGPQVRDALRAWVEAKGPLPD